MIGGERLHAGLLISTRNHAVETLDGRPVLCPVDGEPITDYEYAHALNGHFNLYLTHHGEEYMCGTPEMIREVLPAGSE